HPQTGGRGLRGLHQEPSAEAPQSLDRGHARQGDHVQAGRRARKAGFRVQLTYIAAEVEECIRRVANRLDRGGHGVPPDVIRETHAASLRNLSRALTEFDLVQVYDNSRQAGLDDELALLMPGLA